MPRPLKHAARVLEMAKGAAMAPRLLFDNSAEHQAVADANGIVSLLIERRSTPRRRKRGSQFVGFVAAVGVLPQLQRCFTQPLCVCVASGGWSGRAGRPTQGLTAGHHSRLS